MNHSNLSLLIILSLWLCTGCNSGRKQGEAENTVKPNILFIFADDQCYSTIQALGDTETPEQFVPATGFPGRHWEVCMTMNDTWGYKSYDDNWKSTKILLQTLSDIVSKGGNFLLNVGPTAEGLIPTPSIERLKEIGKWMETNGADGVVYPEPLDIWGLCCVAPRPDGLCGAEHLTHHFSMMLEHAWMALQGHDRLGVSIANDLPWIEGTVKFFDSFYRNETKKRTGSELGIDGKLVIYPGNGLELAGDATNSIDAVCGLKRITAGLLALPELSPESRSNLERIQSILPEISTGMRDGRLSILPAKSFNREYNKWEPIEMYAHWPYRMVGVTKPETMQLARNIWETIPADRARLCKQDYSWMANVVNMAALAWPDSAKKRAIYKMANIQAPQARFPAFFGPGHDWLPDHNSGGSGMTGIQEMLMAADSYGDGKIYLLPAWPKEWDVYFKLNAPQQTTVEATVRNGKVVSLKVNPESRKKDIIINVTFNN